MPNAESPPPPPPEANAETASKPWWKRWWGIALIVLGAIVLISALAGDPDTDTVASGDPTEEVTEAPAEETEPDTTDTEAEPEPEPGFGDGSHVVGEDVEPATYRSDEDTSLCYWARLDGFSGEMDDIIVNGNQGPEIITIAESDAGFETQGCGRWVPVEDTLPDAPATEFTDGTFAVGGHIEPGTYRADGEGGDLCYWARLSSFDGGLEGTITNGNSPTTIEISESDAGFTAFGCGTWTKAS